MMSEQRHNPILLDGDSLTVRYLVAIARDPRLRVEVAPEAMDCVRRGRRQIERIVERYRESYEAWEAGERESKPPQDYGVTTGFAGFKRIPVPPDELETLQKNLLRSHSVGVGDNADADDPANYFPAEVVRAALLIRINAFLKGHSGVRSELVEVLVDMLHTGIVPLVPTRGSLGASGDLCPLSHLFVVLLGEGRYHVVRTPEDFHRPLGEVRPATELAEDLGRAPIEPSFKEGLALSNGANFSAALLALAVHDAEIVAGVADITCSLTLEAICGCARAFDPKVHEARGQIGQIQSASNIRLLVAESRLIDAAAPAVQDRYSVRCAPVVHGASRDAIRYARDVVERELNAATDNPLFFPDAENEALWDDRFAGNWPPGYDGRARISYSAGNFHGQPLGLASDFLAIALAEIANISERRCQMLLDANHNRNLPSNLIARRGVNSGLMITQYSAASLVTENKILTHPASVDSIPTAANIEDHVSMSATAGRKLRTVLGNVEATLAIELMVAAQAVEWRIGLDYRPRSSGGGNEPVADDAGWKAFDREAVKFNAAVQPEKQAAIAERLGRGTGAAYLAVRQTVEPVINDRPLDEDLRRMRTLVTDPRLVIEVETALERPLESVG